MAFHLDIETLLAPIPGSNPSGGNLRYTEVYDQIIEAKRADDELERGEWHTELKCSNWDHVIELCTEALTHKSKDMQIAVWLTEALLQKHGFSGLQFGLKLLCKMLTAFWETLFPEIEDGDLDFRLGTLAYLNEKLHIVVGQVPLCDPKHTKGFGYFEWEESQQVGSKSGLNRKQLDHYQQMIDQGKVCAEDFKYAVVMSPLGFYRDLYGQITKCIKNIELLDKVVTQQFASDPQGFKKLNDSVAACYRIVDKIYNEKKKSEVAADTDEDLIISENKSTQGSVPKENLDRFEEVEENILLQKNAIYDISDEERKIWRIVSSKAENGQLKSALDQLMASAALAPSERQKNRFLLLVAKLCINAGRYDLAQPIVERLYSIIETLNLEKWEHPTWISDVVEALYRCLDNDSNGPSDRAAQLFQKLCTLNVTKAATFRVDRAQ
jgi:type VI secretion system protein ImpA